MDLSQPNGVEGMAVLLEQTLEDNRRLVQALQDVRCLCRCSTQTKQIVDAALEPGGV